MSPSELLQFLHTAELLKRRTRHCWNPDGRRESVAEHCWRTALTADLLRVQFPEPDMDKVVSMCLWHDLGEAVTGDIPVFEKTSGDRAAEDAALFSLLDALPEPEQGRLTGLFREMLAQETPESQLYKVLDKLEALISHNEADLSTWLALEYELQRTYALAETAEDPYLRALRQEILRETEEKIEHT